jgi:hypothetical protein
MPPNDRWLPALDDRPGPAAPLSEAGASTMVDRALEGAFGAVPTPASPARKLTRPRALGATAAVVTAVAVAALVWTQRHRAAPIAPPPVPETRTDEGQSTPPRSDPPTPHPRLPDLPEQLPTAERPGTARANHAPPADVADLLAHANDLRAARRWRDAAQAYERIPSARPASPEAYAAEVAAADLHLEQLRDPAGALRLYRAARSGQAGSGRLGEQVLWGIARSTKALGDSHAEEAALLDYVAKYPTGLFAADARGRLAELGSRP